MILSAPHPVPSDAAASSGSPAPASPGPVPPDAVESQPAPTTPDPAAGHRAGRGGTGRRRSRLLLDIALVALVIAALTGVALSVRATLDDRADDGARAQALAAATHVAVGITSLDYRTFDRDAQRVVAGTAGTLRQQLTTENTALRTAMTTNRSVTSGRVLDAAVVDADRDSARVLLVVDADVTNTSSPKPTARHYRIQLDLSRQHGRWLATDLTFVG